MKKDELVLFGGGGHCKSCIDVIEQEGNYNIAGIVDIPEKLQSKLLGYKFFATDNDIPQLIIMHFGILTLLCHALNFALVIFTNPVTFLRSLGLRHGWR